jgi:hypothetical protein
MRIGVQELTRGCHEWCACLFDKFGQPILSAKSNVSAEDAENKLEEECQQAMQTMQTVGRDKAFY